jgi:putative membrane protein
MWLGPLFMVALLVLLIAGIVALVRWMGGGSDAGGRARTARDILDERYARGEIDREEYVRRRDDMAGRP